MPGPCPALARWNDGAKANITNSVTTLERLYRKFGYLVFSTEGDGLAHLDIERSHPPVDMAAIQEAKAHIATSSPASTRAATPPTVNSIPG